MIHQVRNQFTGSMQVTVRLPEFLKPALFLCVSFSNHLPSKLCGKPFLQAQPFKGYLLRRDFKINTEGIPLNIMIVDVILFFEW